MNEPDWLITARELQAIAQTGLAYCRDPYDGERYRRLMTIAEGMLAEGFAISPIDLAAGLPRQIGYATPQIDVRGALFRDEKVLLVREKSDGRWSLPGGWADVNLSAAQNAEKEFFEEACMRVRATRLTGLYDRRRHPYHPPQPRHCYKLYFLCEWLEGEPQAGDETDAADFFDLDALPPLSQDRVIEAHIRLAKAHLDDPSLTTYLDEVP